MARKDSLQSRRQKRHARIRLEVGGTSSRPRLCVFRSLNHIYAQVVEDEGGHTLVASSTSDPEVKAEAKGKPKCEAAKLVGTLVARRALEKGVNKVVFDRGGYKYHGRVKALAEAARQAGLVF